MIKLILKHLARFIIPIPHKNPADIKSSTTYCKIMVTKQAIEQF